MGWNKGDDWYNVIGAAGIPALPLLVKGRQHVPICGMLVLLDNFTTQQVFSAISGGGIDNDDDDDDEYEYVDDDEDDDY